MKRNDNAVVDCKCDQFYQVEVCTGMTAYLGVENSAKDRSGNLQQNYQTYDHRILHNRQTDRQTHGQY